MDEVDKFIESIDLINGEELKLTPMQWQDLREFMSEGALNANEAVGRLTAAQLKEIYT
jgi:hypothetical protein